MFNPRSYNPSTRSYNMYQPYRVGSISSSSVGTSSQLQGHEPLAANAQLNATPNCQSMTTDTINMRNRLYGQTELVNTHQQCSVNVLSDVRDVVDVNRNMQNAFYTNRQQNNPQYSSPTFGHQPQASQLNSKHSQMHPLGVPTQVPGTKVVNTGLHCTNSVLGSSPLSSTMTIQPECAHTQSIRSTCSSTSGLQSCDPLSCSYAQDAFKYSPGIQMKQDQPDNHSCQYSKFGNINVPYRTESDHPAIKEKNVISGDSNSVSPRHLDRAFPGNSYSSSNDCTLGSSSVKIGTDSCQSCCTLTCCGDDSANYQQRQNNSSIVINGGRIDSGTNVIINQGYMSAGGNIIINNNGPDFNTKQMDPSFTNSLLQQPPCKKTECKNLANTYVTHAKLGRDHIQSNASMSTCINRQSEKQPLKGNSPSNVACVPIIYGDGDKVHYYPTYRIPEVSNSLSALQYSKHTKTYNTETSINSTSKYNAKQDPVSGRYLSSEPLKIIEKSITPDTVSSGRYLIHTCYKPPESTRQPTHTSTSGSYINVPVCAKSQQGTVNQKSNQLDQIPTAAYLYGQNNTNSHIGDSSRSQKYTSTMENNYSNPAKLSGSVNSMHSKLAFQHPSALPKTNIPNYQQPKTNISNCQQPKTNIPNYQQPKTNIPNYQQPKTNIPNCQQPKTNIPNYQQPKTNIPNYQQPNTNIPNYQQPKTNIPNCQQPKTNISNYQQGAPGNRPPGGDGNSCEGNEVSRNKSDLLRTLLAMCTTIVTCASMRPPSIDSDSKVAKTETCKSKHTRSRKRAAVGFKPMEHATAVLSSTYNDNAMSENTVTSSVGAGIAVQLGLQKEMHNKEHTLSIDRTDGSNHHIQNTGHCIADDTRCDSECLFTKNTFTRIKDNPNYNKGQVNEYPDEAINIDTENNNYKYVLVESNETNKIDNKFNSVDKMHVTAATVNDSKLNKVAHSDGSTDKEPSFTYALLSDSDDTSDETPKFTYVLLSDDEQMCTDKRKVQENTEVKRVARLPAEEYSYIKDSFKLIKNDHLEGESMANSDIESTMDKSAKEYVSIVTNSKSFEDIELGRATTGKLNISDVSDSESSTISASENSNGSSSTLLYSDSSDDSSSTGAKQKFITLLQKNWKRYKESKSFKHSYSHLKLYGLGKKRSVKKKRERRKAGSDVCKMAVSEQRVLPNTVSETEFQFRECEHVDKMQNSCNKLNILSCDRNEVGIDSNRENPVGDGTLTSLTVDCESNPDCASNDGNLSFPIAPDMTRPSESTGSELRVNLKECRQSKRLACKTRHDYAMVVKQKPRTSSLHLKRKCLPEIKERREEIIAPKYAKPLSGQAVYCPSPEDQNSIKLKSQCRDNVKEIIGNEIHDAEDMNREIDKFILHRKKRSTTLESLSASLMESVRLTCPGKLFASDLNDVYSDVLSNVRGTSDVIDNTEFQDTYANGIGNGFQGQSHEDQSKLICDRNVLENSETMELNKSDENKHSINANVGFAYDRDVKQTDERRSYIKPVQMKDSEKPMVILNQAAKLPMSVLTMVNKLRQINNITHLDDREIGQMPTKSKMISDCVEDTNYVNNVDSQYLYTASLLPDEQTAINTSDELAYENTIAGNSSEQIKDVHKVSTEQLKREMLTNQGVSKTNEAQSHKLRQVPLKPHTEPATELCSPTDTENVAETSGSGLIDIQYPVRSSTVHCHMGLETSTGVPAHQMSLENNYEQQTEQICLQKSNISATRIIKSNKSATQSIKSNKAQIEQLNISKCNECPAKPMGERITDEAKHENVHVFCKLDEMPANQINCRVLNSVTVKPVDDQIISLTQQVLNDCKCLNENGDGITATTCASERQVPDFENVFINFVKQKKSVKERTNSHSNKMNKKAQKHRCRVEKYRTANYHRSKKQQLALLALILGAGMKPPPEWLVESCSDPSSTESDDEDYATHREIMRQLKLESEMAETSSRNVEGHVNRGDVTMEINHQTGTYKTLTDAMCQTEELATDAVKHFSRNEKQEKINDEKTNQETHQLKETSEQNMVICDDGNAYSPETEHSHVTCIPQAKTSNNLVTDRSSFMKHNSPQSVCVKTPGSVVRNRHPLTRSMQNNIAKHKSLNDRGLRSGCTIQARTVQTEEVVIAKHVLGRKGNDAKMSLKLLRCDENQSTVAANNSHKLNERNKNIVQSSYSTPARKVGHFLKPSEYIQNPKCQRKMITRNRGKSTKLTIRRLPVSSLEDKCGTRNVKLDRKKAKKCQLASIENHHRFYRAKERSVEEIQNPNKKIDKASRKTVMICSTMPTDTVEKSCDAVGSDSTEKTFNNGRNEKSTGTKQSRRLMFNIDKTVNSSVNKGQQTHAKDIVMGNNKINHKNVTAGKISSNFRRMTRSCLSLDPLVQPGSESCHDNEIRCSYCHKSLKAKQYLKLHLKWCKLSPNHKIVGACCTEYKSQRNDKPSKQTSRNSVERLNNISKDDNSDLETTRIVEEQLPADDVQKQKLQNNFLKTAESGISVGTAAQKGVYAIDLDNKSTTGKLGNKKVTASKAQRSRPLYKCSYCKHSTKSKKFYERHQYHHTTAESQLCIPCNILFGSLRSYRQFHTRKNLNHKHFVDTELETNGTDLHIIETINDIDDVSGLHEGDNNGNFAVNLEGSDVVNETEPISEDSFLKAATEVHVQTITEPNGEESVIAIVENLAEDSDDEDVTNSPEVNNNSSESRCSNVTVSIENLEVKSEYVKVKPEDNTVNMDMMEYGTEHNNESNISRMSADAYPIHCAYCGLAVYSFQELNLHVVSNHTHQQERKEYERLNAYYDYCVGMNSMDSNNNTAMDLSTKKVKSGKNCSFTAQSETYRWDDHATIEKENINLKVAETDIKIKIELNDDINDSERQYYERKSGDGQGTIGNTDVENGPVGSNESNKENVTRTDTANGRNKRVNNRSNLNDGFIKREPGDGDDDKTNNNDPNHNDGTSVTKDAELLLCLICHTSFAVKADLLKHLVKVHKLTNLCQLCYFSDGEITKFANAVSLRNHKLRYHPQDMVLCVCGSLLIDEKMLLSHQKKFRCIEKGNNEMVKCVCGKRFVNDDMLSAHQSKCRKRRMTEIDETKQRNLCIVRGKPRSRQNSVTSNNEDTFQDIKQSFDHHDAVVPSTSASTPSSSKRSRSCPLKRKSSDVENNNLRSAVKSEPGTKVTPQRKSKTSSAKKSKVSTYAEDIQNNNYTPKRLFGMDVSAKGMPISNQMSIQALRALRDNSNTVISHPGDGYDSSNALKASVSAIDIKSFSKAASEASMTPAGAASQITGNESMDTIPRPRKMQKEGKPPKKRGRKCGKPDEEGRYPCKVCRRRFKRPYLYVHQKWYHQKKQWIVVPTAWTKPRKAGISKTATNSRPYKCGWCRFVSTRRSSVVLHHYRDHQDEELRVGLSTLDIDTAHRDGECGSHSDDSKQVRI